MVKNFRSRRQQKGGDGNHNIQSVGYPIQWFNPASKVPAYYPDGHEMLTKTYQTAYGPSNPVNTTTANSCLTEMGPNLGPFNPYDGGVSQTMTGGGNTSLFETIVNPITNRKVSVNSKLGRQILGNYMKQLNH